MKIAIVSTSGSKIHSTSWELPWITFCNINNYEFEKVFIYDSKIIDKLKEFDILLWHFSGYLFKDMMFAKSILFSAKQMGLKIFPDFNDCWHFDDKIAETYLLQSINAPIPKSNMFYDYHDVVSWVNSNENFPVVAKLRNGSGSHNIVLIKSKEQLLKYSKKMFGKGLTSSPSLIYKASSNLKSSKSIKTFFLRVKKIPEFLRTLRNANKFPNEKGYVFLQEFVKNSGFDLKVVVVGDKLSFIARNIRKNDFRASGSGDLFYDRSLVSKNVIDSAFKTSDTLGFNCMGYDYVIDENTGEGKIVEISYGFSHEALLGANGYYDRNGDWHDEPLNAPYDILKNIISIKSN